MLHYARDMVSFFLMSLRYENLLRTRVALSFLVPVPVRQLGGAVDRTAEWEAVVRRKML